MSRRSLGGSWGDGKLKEKNVTQPTFGMTTNSELFGYQHIEQNKTNARHPHAKFSRMKETNAMIMSYSDTNAHTVHSQAWEAASDAEDSMNGGTNTVNVDSAQTVAMSRTFEKLLKEGDAPIAVGRSGHRTEVGINASGLLGERLLKSDEPSRNTFVQRTWLPHDDPALVYKENGIPKAFMPDDVSLSLGPNSEVAPGWVHFREATFTGKPLSKVGARRAGVFMDEFKADGSRQAV